MNKKIILVVDDNKPTCDLLSEIITAEGYHVLTAQNGDDALALVSDQNISCAIIDQYMDPMDGFSLARELKIRGQSYPLIMMTAHESPDLLLEAQKNGFSTILLKPVQPLRLLKALEKLSRY